MERKKKKITTSDKDFRNILHQSVGGLLSHSYVGRGLYGAALGGESGHAVVGFMGGPGAVAGARSKNSKESELRDTILGGAIGGALAGIARTGSVEGPATAATRGLIQGSLANAGAYAFGRLFGSNNKNKK